MLVVVFVCTFSLHWFNSFGGEDDLSLSSHVYFLYFFRFREEFGGILDVDGWPGEIVYPSDGFDPRGFCWKTCYCMKVYYGWFNGWEFIHITYGFWCGFGHACLYMVYCSWNCWDRIEGIY